MLHVLVFVPPQYFARQLIETYAATSSLFSVSRLPVSCLIPPRPFHHPINNVIKNSGNICTKTQLILNFLPVSQTEIIFLLFFYVIFPFFSVLVCICVCVFVNLYAKKMSTVNVEPPLVRGRGVEGGGECDACIWSRTVGSYTFLIIKPARNIICCYKI